MRRATLLLLLTTCAAGSGGGLVHSSEWKLVAGDAFDDDLLGASVSISGNSAIIGAPYDDDNGTNSGSAYMFRRVEYPNPFWYEQAKLVADDGDAYDCFGAAVAISGDWAIVGAPEDDDQGADSGSVYLFHWEDPTWVLKHKFTASDGDENDLFGRAVAISGDYAIVGAPSDEDLGSTSGSVYVFHHITEFPADYWYQQAKLTASDGASSDFFGSSVAISGDCAIVGAKNHDGDAGIDSGSAYVFYRDGTDWNQEWRLEADDGAPYDLLGSSVAISGGRAVVGAVGDDVFGDNSGSAYVFRRMQYPNPWWSQEAKLNSSSGAAYDSFGDAVAISGFHVVVGAPNSDEGGYDTGSVYAFELKESGWSGDQLMIASDAVENDEFGFSVAVSGDLVVVGAPHLNELDVFTGAAYAYEWDDFQWLLFADGFESGNTLAWTTTVP